MTVASSRDRCIQTVVEAPKRLLVAISSESSSGLADRVSHYSSSGGNRGVDRTFSGTSRRWLEIAIVIVMARTVVLLQMLLDANDSAKVNAPTKTTEGTQYFGKKRNRKRQNPTNSGMVKTRPQIRIKFAQAISMAISP